MFIFQAVYFGFAEKLIMRNKSIDFILFSTLQVQGNMTKALKTLALENLTNSVHLFKNRFLGANSIRTSIKSTTFLKKK